VSPKPDRLRRRRHDGPDAGFTLIEVMVALTVLALAAMAAVPLLIGGAAAANSAKLHTQAKNLAQLRVEKMRDLQFHVERQNGPYVDLLDQYYTSRSTTTVTRTFGAETSTGQWVGSGTPASWEPSVPFYRVTVAALPGYSNFSQVIDTQFLKGDGTLVDAASFAGYDSQVEASDGPPSFLMGVTVLTSWTFKGQTKSYKYYTRIADGRGMNSLLTSQAKAEAVRVTSGDPSGKALNADVATATANGSLTTGSASSIEVRGGLASDGVSSDVVGANWLARAPSGYSAGALSSGAVSAGGSGPCGWAAFGASNVQNATAAITGGVPLVPANVDGASPPANQASAALIANGSNPCGLFSFNNATTTYSLPATPGSALVRIPDPGGSAREVVSSAWVRASDALANPHTVGSGAATQTSRRVEILPGLVAAGQPTSFIADGRGLVNVTLTSSSITCGASVTAGSPQSQSAAGSYNVTVDYWVATNATGGGARTSTTFPWSSADAASADPLASLLPSSIVVYQNGATTYLLSDFISSWSLLRSVTEGATNGVHSLDGVLSLATVPLRSVGGVPDPTSSVGVQVGRLSCVADDNR
jgi:prepilin-type N-terminal cleavage/methylation domain-containing protein